MVHRCSYTQSAVKWRRQITKLRSSSIQGEIWSLSNCWFCSMLFLICVTEQHYVSIFFILVYNLCAKLYFSGTWIMMTNQQRHFSPVFALFLLAIWFCNYTHAQLWILKFQDSFISSLFWNQIREVCAQTINVWRKSKRSVV